MHGSFLEERSHNLKLTNRISFFLSSNTSMKLHSLKLQRGTFRIYRCFFFRIEKSQIPTLKNKNWSLFFSNIQIHHWFWSLLKLQRFHRRIFMGHFRNAEDSISARKEWYLFHSCFTIQISSWFNTSTLKTGTMEFSWTPLQIKQLQF